MATRFGRVSPTQAYQAKMRWAIGGLFTLIVVLVGFIFLLAKGSDSPPPVSQNQNPTQALAASSQVVSPTVDVLVAVKRIEEGAVLDDHLFRAHPWDVEALPESVVLYRDLASVRGKFAKSLISANLPILRTDITDTRPISALNIPPGYRAVSIDVNLRSGVEGFAKPNTRVDVLWSYTGPDRQRKVATIVRFTKVLSVGGSTHTEQGRAQLSGKSTTVTLLVTEKDAKKIELARTLGTISLSLVGDREPGSAVNDEPDEIDIYDLIPRPKDDGPREEPNDGVMYTQDPKTGKQVRYVLRNGRWQQDDNF